MDDLYLFFVLITGFALVIASIIWFAIDLRKAKKLLQIAETEKTELRSIIADAEIMVNELNNFSNYLLEKIDHKNNETSTYIDTLEASLINAKQIVDNWRQSYNDELNNTKAKEINAPNNIPPPDETIDEQIIDIDHNPAEAIYEDPDYITYEDTPEYTTEYTTENATATENKNETTIDYTEEYIEADETKTIAPLVLFPYINHQTYDDHNDYSDDTHTDHTDHTDTNYTDHSQTDYTDHTDTYYTDHTQTDHTDHPHDHNTYKNDHDDGGGFTYSAYQHKKKRTAMTRGMKYIEVMRRYEEGMDEAEIAKALNIGRGEVELILGLRNENSAIHLN